MIVPERGAARKAAEKLKAGSGNTAADPNSAPAAPPPSGLTSDGQLRSRNKKRRETSSSPEERDSSQDTRNTESDNYGLVPQRKAAKRATDQLKSADKIGSNKEENMLLGGVPPPMASSDTGIKLGFICSITKTSKSVNDFSQTDHVQARFYTNLLLYLDTAIKNFHFKVFWSKYFGATFTL